MNKTRGRWRVGDWVEVRSKEEILRTLNCNGQLDGMPFMPEMFAYCGKRFRVQKRAHKTCDTVFPTRSRRVSRAVHLDTRCDGSAHGGCQAGCLIFWKEEWLKPVDPGSAVDLVSIEMQPGVRSRATCTEAEVWDHAQALDGEAGKLKYVCQATRLPYATTELAWWDIRQYLEDYTSGNVTFGQLFKGLMYSIYYNLSQAGIGLGQPMRWFYDRICGLWGGSRFPRLSGTIPAGEPTPTGSLNLQPGELVRVKSHQEILETIATDNKNRGMAWDAEMVPYCGGTYRVLKSVTKIVDERTGKMQEMKNPCIILDTVVCQARYSGCRMFCPRQIYPYWREIWLERVESCEAAGAEEEKVSVSLSEAAEPVGSCRGMAGRESGEVAVGKESRE